MAVSYAATPRPQAEGLSSAEAARRLETHGPNRIESAAQVSAWRILARQFQSLLVLILIAAAALAAALGETIDAAAIAAIVVLNAVLGFAQEWRAERAIEALRDMLSPLAEVIRDGAPRRIASAELVPGDLVVLSEGQKVPADLQLTRTVGLKLDESILTGESVPVDRDAADDDAQAFMGALVAAGRAEGVVTATGRQTRFGRIADLTQSVGEKTTRLQRQLATLARQLGLVGLSVAAGLLGIGLLAGRDPFDMALTALSMAVAVVPEGLPVVVTLTLAIGATAMARQKALLRRLQAAETLGAASVICTDKTGTLTENKMTVTALVLPAARYEITGTGHDPAGRVLRDGAPVRAETDGDLAWLLHAAQVCNNARLVRDGADWAMIGDPTEGALITLARKAWAETPDPDARLAETPFSSLRKRMGMLAPGLDGRPRLMVKGAPEAVLPLCTRVRAAGAEQALTDTARAGLEAEYEALAAQGLRVIALADRPARDAHDTEEQELAFLGFAGLLDPPRPEIREAVHLCRRAGIRLVMITGDSLTTAGAVAGRVGIDHEHAIRGADLEDMPDATLDAALAGGNVLFARTAPVHKMRIVERLQAAGAIVAMTGDGVNDAPALRRADIGVAMGQRGTDVAKEASDLVILDDNFATIVRAIAEGRRQFANIRRFVRYLLSSNSAEVLALTVNLLIGGPLLLLPIHILWMNLLTDGVSAVALGLEPGQDEQMSEPPLSRDARVLTRAALPGLAAFGLYMAAATLAVFYLLLPMGEDEARTAAFTTLVLCQEVAVFAFRSDRQSAWAAGFGRNPWLVAAVAAMIALQGLAVYWPPLQLMLGTVPLGAEALWHVVLAVAPLIVGPTLVKAWAARRG